MMQIVTVNWFKQKKIVTVKEDLGGHRFDFTGESIIIVVNSSAQLSSAHT